MIIAAYHQLAANEANCSPPHSKMRLSQLVLFSKMILVPRVSIILMRLGEARVLSPCIR
jgi:hypothetical protein